MFSIITAVFKATIGLLVNKGRDKAAENLKDGDVTDQKFCRLIVREIDDIKSQLDGLQRKDLLASVSFFEEGIKLLYDVFDKAKSRSENSAVTTKTACDEAFESPAKEMKTLTLTDLDESVTRALSDAKKKLGKAREKATAAFNDKALNTPLRILAMKFRVMATILETVDNPADAVAPCRMCIEELHCLLAVKESIKVELTKGLLAWSDKRERRRTITNVCHVNSVIYSVTLMVCFGNKQLSNWPYIGSGEDKVDPLRDERVAAILRKQGIGHCYVIPWSFGQEGGEEHKLEGPEGIASNSSGQFIVGDSRESMYSDTVKVFDSSGRFMKHFSLPNDGKDENTHLKTSINDVATDINDNIYVLVFRILDRLGEEHEELQEAYLLRSSGTSGECGCRKNRLRRRKAIGHLPEPKIACEQAPRLEKTEKNVKPKTVRVRYVIETVYERAVYKFNSTTDKHYKFVVKDGTILAVTDSGKMLVLSHDMVHVYQADGQFVRSLGEGILKDARDMAVTNDGCVMVAEWRESCVHIFSEHGDHLNKLNFPRLCSLPRIAFHRPSDHLITASMETWNHVLHVKIYTKDGEFVRSNQIYEKGFEGLRGLTVTTEGRIAFSFWNLEKRNTPEVLVL